MRDLDFRFTHYRMVVRYASLDFACDIIPSSERPFTATTRVLRYLPARVTLTRQALHI